MSISLTTDLALAGGKIDIEASVQVFRAAAVKRQAELETEQAEIAQAVEDLFDRNLGKAIAMPTLGSMVAQALNAVPENFKVLSERALDYVRQNSQTTGSEKEGTLVQHPDSLFVIGKGKNGGCYRRADRPAPAAK